jgi:hypothetical protein
VGSYYDVLPDHRFCIFALHFSFPMVVGQYKNHVLGSRGIISSDMEACHFTAAYSLEIVAADSPVRSEHPSAIV